MIQIREYMGLIGGITGREVKGFICYMEPTEIIEVYG